MPLGSNTLLDFKQFKDFLIFRELDKNNLKQIRKKIPFALKFGIYNVSTEDLFSCLKHYITCIFPLLCTFLSKKRELI